MRAAYAEFLTKELGPVAIPRIPKPEIDQERFGKDLIYTAKIQAKLTQTQHVNRDLLETRYRQRYPDAFSGISSGREAQTVIRHLREGEKPAREARQAAAFAERQKAAEEPEKRSPLEKLGGAISDVADTPIPRFLDPASSVSPGGKTPFEQVTGRRPTVGDAATLVPVGGAGAAAARGIPKLARLGGAVRAGGRAAPKVATEKIPAVTKRAKGSLLDRTKVLAHNRAVQLGALEAGGGGGAYATRGEKAAKAARNVVRAPGSPVDPVGKTATAIFGPAGASGAPRLGGLRFAGKALGTGTRLVKSAAKLGAVGSVGAQVPSVVATGDLSKFKGALEGTGTFAKGVHKVSNLLPQSVAGNIIRDLFELPAQAIPSVYLPLAGIFEAAAKDDSTRLDMLKKEYIDSGFIPGLVKGDIDQALKSAKEHPLFSALEVSGAHALVGRGAGAALRRLPGEVGSQKRAPLRIYGNVAQERRYSANVITKQIQKAREAHARRQGRDPNQATTKQQDKYLRHAVDQTVNVQEGVRRAHRDAATGALEGGFRGRGGVQPRKGEGVVSLAAQRILRRPDTFHQDLARYKQIVDHAYNKGELTRSEGKANRHLAAEIAAAQKIEDPKLIASIFKAADKFVGEHGRRTAELIDRGLLDPKQVAKAGAIPFARVHMGARYGLSRAAQARIARIKEEMKGATPETQGRLLSELSSLRSKRQTLDANGHPLRLEQIQAEMKGHGVAPAGFLTHRPGWRGGGSFYQSFEGGRGTLPKARRSGKAVTKGAFDASFAALSEQIARTQTIGDRARAFDSFTGRFAVKKPDGGYWKSFQEAADAARDPLNHGINPGGQELVPWSAAPFRASKAEVDAAKRHADPAAADSLLDPGHSELPGNLLGEAIQRATKPGNGPYLLIPKTVADRLAQHHQSSNLAIEKGMQAFTTSFKSAVLPTSTKWVIGNAVEASMRSVMDGLGFGDYILGRRLLKHAGKADPLTAEQIRAGMVGGAHFASFKRTTKHRGVEQFVGTKLYPVAKGLASLRAQPTVGRVVNGYLKYRDAVFGLNGLMEQQPQIAALGKAARRDLQETTGRWHHGLAVGRGAIEDLAKGLVNTDKQHRYADSLGQVFGHWGRMSPGERKFLVDYAPFYLWARASTRFVLATLPRHHPIKTGLIAAATEMTEKERKRLGLSLLIADETNAGPVPGFLHGAIPGAGGKLIPTNNYSSFGVFADYPAFMGNVVLPQLGFMDGLKGIDWKGDKLTNLDGSDLKPWQGLAIAAYITGESQIPFLRMARTALEGGEAASPTSTIFNPRTIDGKKPSGSFLAGLARATIPRTYSAEQVANMRRYSKMRQITVPIGGSTTRSSSSNPYSSIGSGSSNPYSSVGK